MEAAERTHWLSTDDYGVVDKIEAERIVTSFYRVILPVWPEASAYVIRAQDGTERRIAIPLQRRSVLLAYLRAPLWFLAAACLGPLLFATSPWTGLVVPGAMFAGLAAFFTWVAGRLPEAEKQRRQQLRRVVGFGAPPELLPETLCAEVRRHLQVMWTTRSSTDWRDAIDAGETSELLVALAEYHFDADTVARAHANFDKKLWN